MTLEELRERLNGLDTGNGPVHALTAFVQLGLLVKDYDAYAEQLKRERDEAEDHYQIAERDSIRWEQECRDAWRERDEVVEALRRAGKDIHESLCASDRKEDPHCVAHHEIMALLDRIEGDQDDQG